MNVEYSKEPQANKKEKKQNPNIKRHNAMELMHLLDKTLDSRSKMRLKCLKKL